MISHLRKVPSYRTDHPSYHDHHLSSGANILLILSTVSVSPVLYAARALLLQPPCPAP